MTSPQIEELLSTITSLSPPARWLNSGTNELPNCVFETTTSYSIPAPDATLKYFLQSVILLLYYLKFSPKANYCHKII